ERAIPPRTCPKRSTSKRARQGRTPHTLGSFAALLRVQREGDATPHLGDGLSCARFQLDGGQARFAALEAQVEASLLRVVPVGTVPARQFFDELYHPSNDSVRRRCNWVARNRSEAA